MLGFLCRGCFGLNRLALTRLALNRLGWAWLLWGTLGLCQAAVAQDPPLVPPVESEEMDADRSEQEPTEITTTDDIIERLDRAERELEALKNGTPASTAGEGESGSKKSLGEAVSDRLRQAKDPSITTVDEQTRKSADEKAKEKSKKWFERLSIRGYAQFRYNTSLFEEDDSFPIQHAGDRSVGDDQNFLIRRARLILSGDLSDHLYVYLQPDFAAGVPGSTDAAQFTQIRDWYGDIYVDTDKVHRFRVGQSKVPYGWENLQSSSNRLALDRSDGLNSAVRNERDLGIFYYWTPEEGQDLFKEVLDKGLKGSGNYGVFGFGVYNGQGGSFVEQNDDLHLVTRLAVPFQFENEQIMELGIQAYTGKYTVLSSPIRPLGIGSAVRPIGTLETDGRDGIRDERVAGTFVWYPQPLGFQAEWNVGNGPGLNDAQTAVVERALQGGYAMVYYRQEFENKSVVFPFARFNFFRGGYKAERNAPYSDVKEWEMGLEWQLTPQIELTTQYTISDRTNTVAQSVGRSYGQYEGHLLRTQLQINY
jgi:hypothetical protein